MELIATEQAESQIDEEYKKTEVGVIPNDWEVKLLGAVSEVKTGPFGSSLHEKDYVRDGTPIITVEHLGELGIIQNNMPMVSDYDKKRLQTYSLQTDDIVFSRVGSVDRNSIVSEKESGWLFSGRLLRIRITTNDIYPKYLSYYFHQESTKQRVKAVAVGQTMPSLNTQILKGIEISFPPTVIEQKAIATALSDLDALINSLDKLIAKKNAIKQGAMQQLLKSPKQGGKRLAGFEGEWEDKELGCLGGFFKGKGIKKDDVLSDGFPCIRYGELYTIYDNLIKSFVSYVNDDVAKQSCVVKSGDILFAGSGETKEEIGKCAALICSQPVYAGGDIIVFRPKEVDSTFLGYILNSTPVSKQKAARGQGDAVVHIYSSGLSKIVIPIPPAIAEQQAIATILSDMDDEIIALEKKKSKYHSIKQGMMQELLTGKTRLV